jgi:hypothetical protein
VPARTNLFQRAVRVLHENIAGDAVVKESDMLRDSDTGDLVEVDVTITTSVVAQKIVIGVEATAAGRKATRPWVDSMLGKHASLPTDRLVLVTEAGFSSAASKKAEANRAVPLMPSDLQSDESVGTVVNKLGTVFIKAVTLQMDEVAISARSPDPLANEPFEGAPVGTPLFRGDGEFICTVADSVKADFDRRFADIAKEIDLANVVAAETREITLTVTGPLKASRVTDSGTVPAGHACIRLDEEGTANSHYWPVQQISVKGRLEFEVGEIPLTHAKLSGLSAGFSFGEGSLGDKSATFIVDESSDQPRGRMIIETDDGPLESMINPVIESHDPGAND